MPLGYALVALLVFLVFVMDQESSRIAKQIQRQCNQLSLVNPRSPEGELIQDTILYLSREAGRGGVSVREVCGN